MNAEMDLTPSTGGSVVKDTGPTPRNRPIGFWVHKRDNPQDPPDLGREIEFWLEDEKHVLTRSCLIFVPRGMKHCPLILKRVDRPIFLFSTVTGGQYRIIRDKEKQ